MKELLNAPEGVRVVDVERLYRDAERAWEALSVLLGGREWFEGGRERGSEAEEEDDEGDEAVDEAVKVGAKRKQKHGGDKHKEDGDGGGGGGNNEPGLFDAEVFSYTCLILDPRMAMTESRLAKGLLRHGNLVAHRQRILDRYFHEED